MRFKIASSAWCRRYNPLNRILYGTLDQNDTAGVHDSYKIVAVSA